MREYDRDMNEYGCDKCGTDVPNGSGCYVGDDRLCTECAARAISQDLDALLGD